MKEKQNSQEKQLKTLSKKIYNLQESCNEILSHTEPLWIESLHKKRYKFPRISLDQARKWSIISISICIILATFKYLFS